MTYRFFFYSVLAAIGLLHTSVFAANDEEQQLSDTNVYCLSGGIRRGYSCENSSGQEEETFFTYQLLLSEGQTLDHLLGQAQDIVYQTVLPEEKVFVYFGRYSSINDAVSGAQQWRSQVISNVNQLHPMVVEFTPAKPLPRIRLAQKLFDEPEGYEGQYIGLSEDTDKKASPVQVDQTSTDQAVVESRFESEDITLEPVAKALQAELQSVEAEDADELLKDKVKTQFHGTFYTVQLASFKHVEGQREFYEKYSEVQLYCRQRDNGLYTVSLGLFDDYNSAKEVLLGKGSMFDRLGPYVVRLDNVSIETCNAG